MRGAAGVIERVHGDDLLPDAGARGKDEPVEAVYAVASAPTTSSGRARSRRSACSSTSRSRYLEEPLSTTMTDHARHPRPASDPELRARALEALLVERGLISTDAIDAVVEYYENDVGPQNGARVVARAWVDPGYRERLLATAARAIAELGFGGVEGEHMVVVENTPRRAQRRRLHALLLLSVAGARAAAHLVQEPAPTARASSRSRARVLREFGLELAADVEVRVWDSSAEVRYLVLPRAARRAPTV